MVDFHLHEISIKYKNKRLKKETKYKIDNNIWVKMINEGIWAVSNDKKSGEHKTKEKKKQIVCERERQCVLLTRLSLAWINLLHNRSGQSTGGGDSGMKM